MGTMVTTRPWMREREYAADCVSAASRHAELGAQLTALEAEESDLLRELNKPASNAQRHRAAGVALADGNEPENAEPDVRMRLKEIADRKPALSAALVVLGERYERSLQEARIELAKELRPEYVERLKPMVEAAVDLLAAAKAEHELRVPLVQQDVPFSGTLQGLPFGGAQPDGQLTIWLRRVDRHYPELKVAKLAEKDGVEL